jgi:hypothetical protein
MQPRPSFDRALLIPIAIGVVSILGIGWILLTIDLGTSVIPPTAAPSSLSSSEDVMPTPSPLAPPTKDETPEAQTPSTATETVPDSYPGPPAETLPSTSTLVTESPSSPTATSTPDQIQMLRAGKYDDMDLNIAYDRYWTVLKNLSTAGSYRGTIHASTGIGNEASFRFTGERFRLGYKRGKNFGTVTVIIDDQPYRFHEQAFDLVWNSPQLSPGDHFVRIIHESGQSINLDYIEILD